MSENNPLLRQDYDDETFDYKNGSDTEDEVRAIVGSFSEITDGLSIRHAEEEPFDVSEILTRADATIPGAAAIADAVNQYGYALVRFPDGKSWNDLMPRNTPGYEGWSHFATYADNGGVGGGNAAIRQA